MKYRPDWPLIRSVYAKGEGSLRDLATRFDVPIRTLERRCSREGWARVVAVADGTLAATAAETAARAGRELGNTAAGFVARSIQVTNDLLSELDRLLHTEELSPATLRQLTAALRELTEVGREAYGLNDASRVATTWGGTGGVGGVIDITPVLPVAHQSPLMSLSDATDRNIFTPTEV